MSFHDSIQRQTTYDGQDVKADNTGSQSADDDDAGKSKKIPKHRRNYQACEPCRERKVKCDLGDVDNPRNGPCAKCARESKTCWFRETRKKEGMKDGGARPTKRQRTDSANSGRAFSGLIDSPQQGHNTMARSSLPLSPVRQFGSSTPPVSSPVRNMNGFPQPRSTPAQYSQPATSPNIHRLNMDYPAAYDRTSNGEDHVVMPEASRLNRNFTNTMDGLDTLLHATKSVESKANAQELLNRNRERSGNTNEADSRTVPDQFTQSRAEARELWNQMRFVRAGWLTADEALEYIEYFYSHLAPMTPVISQYFRDPATHRELLVEEPVLALAILAITSRYYQLKGPGAVSRNYHIHSDLWDSLRKIVQRLLWGQEQFGGGFTGAGTVSIQQLSSGQLTWKGSLRTLGTVEALLLLTDWQPRALHFPPGNDENKLIGAGFALIEEERPKAADNSGLPYATWLEPAWRSDRMSWMLLGLAQSLSFELGVFDTRHEHCGHAHGPSSDCAKKRRLRRLVITYVCQISGRIGIQTSLTPNQDDDPLGPELLTHTDQVERLWFEIASIMFEANRDIFPSRDVTSRLIDSGEYKASIRHFQPKLQRWMRDFERIQRDMHPAMKVVLSMEYQYSRLYVNSLGLQKVVGQMALQDRKTINRGLPTQLGSVFEENKSYIDEVRNAADSILRSSCHGLGDLKALGYSPVRTFLRTLSALMFSLKLFSLGNEERIVRATFKLLREMTKRMSEQVVDDVHLMPHTAELIQKLMDDVHSSMVRITKPGSRGQSRQMSPQLPGGQPGPNGASIPFSTVSDQESPDPLAQLPFADWTNHIYMPPPGYEAFGLDSGGYDMNVDPALFPNGDDWISMPIDNLLNLDVTTVNQGYGGIGPTVGDRDMLSLITGSQLDQNQGLGSGLPNFMGMGNGF